MKERIITITIDKAREWYNSENESLKEIALQAFNESELKFDFRNIKTFKKACEALDIDFDYINSIIRYIIISGGGISSAIMLKLNIIKKALNLGQDLSFTENSKNSYLYYPYNPCVNKNSTLYKSKLDLGEIEIIGKIKVGKTEYNILGGGATCSCASVGCYGNYGEFLGCATEEIAKHFGKYFGMTITKAKYSNLEDFKIITNYYEN